MEAVPIIRQQCFGITYMTLSFQEGRGHHSGYALLQDNFCLQKSIVWSLRAPFLNEPFLYTVICLCLRLQRIFYKRFYCLYFLWLVPVQAVVPVLKSGSGKQRNQIVHC